MTRHLPLTLLAAALALLVTAAAPRDAWSQDARAKAILDSVDDLYRADSSHSVLTMTVKTENYTRDLKMEAWSSGKDKSLIRIQEPLKEKGTATLKSGSNAYTYLPKTDRTIRLTSGMMQSSWMGSHATNDDLVRESRLAEDYTWKISFEGERGGQKVIEITLSAREDAAVAWDKVTLVVRADDSIPVEQRFYDERGTLERTMTFTDVGPLGGRTLPRVMRLIPADKPGEYTELTYTSLEFGVKLDDSLFSKASLKR